MKENTQVSSFSVLLIKEEHQFPLYVSKYY